MSVLRGVIALEDVEKFLNEKEQKPTKKGLK
jgi:hypothetical protein